RAQLIVRGAGCFNYEFIGSLLHSSLQIRLEIRGLALQQQIDVPHGLVILLDRAQAVHAGSQAALYVVLQTGPIRFAVDLHSAGTKLKVLVDQVERIPRQRDRQEWSVILRSVLQDCSSDHRTGRAFICDLDVRILLVVFEENVKDRFVLLDQILFKRQRFELGIGDDESDVGYAGNEIAGPELACAVGVKVLADAIAKVLSLADIDYL